VSAPRSRRPRLAREPAPGAPPGTLVVDAAHGERSRIFVIDYCAEHVIEKELASIDEVIPFLEDDRPSITWVDVRGLGDRHTLERMGEIFHIHPLALEDVVNAPQRPHSDAYPDQQLVISRMVQLTESGAVDLEQLGVLFGEGYVLTVQEEASRDCLENVRERIRRGKGPIRRAPSDYLVYALLDAVVDGFYPVLETLGERLEDLELEAAEAPRSAPRKIHALKRSLLDVRRAVWPQSTSATPTTTWSR
jgi:magnesium transporter